MKIRDWLEDWRTPWYREAWTRMWRMWSTIPERRGPIRCICLHQRERQGFPPLSRMSWRRAAGSWTEQGCDGTRGCDGARVENGRLAQAEPFRSQIRLSGRKW